MYAVIFQTDDISLDHWVRDNQKKVPNIVFYLPNEGSVYDYSNGNRQQRNRVRFVKEIQGNLVHRFFIYSAETVDTSPARYRRAR